MAVLILASARGCLVVGAVNRICLLGRDVAPGMGLVLRDGASRLLHDSRLVNRGNFGDQAF